MGGAGNDKMQPLTVKSVTPEQLHGEAAPRKHRRENLAGTGQANTPWKRAAMRAAASGSDEVGTLVVSG